MNKSAVSAATLALSLFALPLAAHAVTPVATEVLTKLATDVSCSHPGDATADVDAHVSTLGLGLGIAFPVNDCVGVRLSFNQFNHSLNTSTSGASYSGKLKLNSYEGLVDWFPFEGVTHLTAGVVYNNNKVDLNSAGPFTLNGTQYTTGTLFANVTFRSWAPYLGFGWSGQPKKGGWSFKSDLGVLFQGSPSVTLTSSNAAAAGALANEQALLNDKLRNYRYYPVLSLGLGYAF